jgi:hypothetical protein
VPSNNVASHVQCRPDVDDQRVVIERDVVEHDTSWERKRSDSNPSTYRAL